MWVVVSHINSGRAFYPISLLSYHLKAIRLNHTQAKEKDASFWKGKNVLFHFGWLDTDQWIDYFQSIPKLCRNFIIEFDADQHLNRLESFDERGWKVRSDFITKIFRGLTDTFIWETPLNWNPFLEPTHRIKLRLYDEHYEKRIASNSSVDFLIFIDQGARNGTLSLDLAEKLNKDFNVEVLIPDKNFYEKYKNKTQVKLIPNAKFTTEGIESFNKKLQDVKVFVDLSYRLTTGRVIYEALYNGAISVCSDTYGASEILFPQWTVETTKINLPLVYDTCLDCFEHSNKKGFVEEYRNSLIYPANILRTVHELGKACI